jgi:hypothetical protein
MGTSQILVRYTKLHVNSPGFSPDTLFTVLDANRLHPGGRDEWENWEGNLLSPGLHAVTVASYSLTEGAGDGRLGGGGVGGLSLPNMFREKLKDALPLSLLLVIRKLPSAQLASCVDLLCQLSPKWDEKCRKQGNISLAPSYVHSISVD